MTALLTLWIWALTIAALGAWILFDASLGFNWALWMPLAAAGLALCAGLAEGELVRWAFALGQAVPCDHWADLAAASERLVVLDEGARVYVGAVRLRRVGAAPE